MQMNPSLIIFRIPKSKFERPPNVTLDYKWCNFQPYNISNDNQGTDIIKE